MEVVDLPQGYLRIEVYNEQSLPVSNATVTIFNGNLMAVSYTHLDVYKRQNHDRLNRHVLWP